MWLMLVNNLLALSQQKDTQSKITEDLSCTMTAQNAEHRSSVYCFQLFIGVFPVTFCLNL